jgi:hypothetical protein
MEPAQRTGGVAEINGMSIVVDDGFDATRAITHVWCGGVEPVE